VGTTSVFGEVDEPERGARSRHEELTDLVELEPRTVAHHARQEHPQQSNDEGE